MAQLQRSRVALKLCLLVVVTFFNVTDGCAKSNKESKYCKILERQHLKAPAFGPGDNLSFANCGLWERDVNQNVPWRVMISGAAGDCPGILISPTLVLVAGCPLLEHKFRTENAVLEARLGKCYKKSGAQSDCMEDELGQISQVREFHPLPKSKGLSLWKVEKVSLAENWIRPICLFNKDNSGDFQGQQFSSAYDVSWSIGQKVELLQCNLQQVKLNEGCDKMSTSICVKLTASESGYLLHLDSDRFFLRGIWDFADSSNLSIFTDILYLMEEIIAVPNDLAKITKQDFMSAKTGLNIVGCGQKPPKRRRRETFEMLPQPEFIVGGADAQDGQHPWHASISTNYGDEDIEHYDLCGATLISRRAVLTAAHCVYDLKHKRKMGPGNLTVALGMHDRFNSDSSFRWQTLTPTSMIVHPDYDRTKKGHNLALLMFKEPGFNITSWARPICLWDQEDSIDSVANRVGEVFGWGYTDKHVQPDILQRVEIPVVSHLECYLQDRKFYSRYLKPGRNFCAGISGSSSCKGDSGGGFALANGTQWYLRGVVSFGAGKTVKDTNKTTCDPAMPDLYVDLGSYMNWIVQTVANFTSL